MNSRKSSHEAAAKVDQSAAIDDVELVEMDKTAPAGSAALLKGNMDVIKNVRVRLDVKIGEAELPVSELFALTRDSVVAIDKDVSAPVDILLDGRVVARGSLVAVGDNFGVRITEIAGS